MKIFCPFCGIANAPELSTCRACGTALPESLDAATFGMPNRSKPHDAQAFGTIAPYDTQESATATGGYPTPVQPEMASRGASSYPSGYPDLPAQVPYGYQPQPVHGQTVMPASGAQPGGLAPVGPFNGAYPAHYVPSPPGNVYLPGDPRAYRQASPGPYSVGRSSGGHQPAVFTPAPAYLQNGQLELADSGTRLGAFMLDAMALTVPWFVLTGLAAATASTLLTAMSLMVMFFGPALYFIACWANGGQTLGYRALGLKLVRTDGSQPGVGSAIARCLGIMICLFMLVPGALGLLWMLWDDRRQALHDKMADTLVVKT